MASLKLLRANTSWDLELQGVANQSPARHSLGVCKNNRGIHRRKLFQSEKPVSRLSSTSAGQVLQCREEDLSLLGVLWELPRGPAARPMHSQTMAGAEHRMAPAPSAELVLCCYQPTRTECTTYEWMHTKR